MAPEVQAIFDAMERPKRDAVRIALAAAATDDTMPDCYQPDQQAADVVVAVYRLQAAGPIRMIKTAAGALLDGRVRAMAAARRETAA
jgi:hypothetical protein